MQLTGAFLSLALPSVGMGGGNVVYVEQKANIGTKLGKAE
jgi:hypothetical protein